MHLQRTSPTMAGIFVRGLTGNKVNVFVDGVRYSTSAARGGVNTFLDLIEPTSLEGVEVLRGPNSAQYGSDALGGSVQFLVARRRSRRRGGRPLARRFGGAAATRRPERRRQLARSATPAARVGSRATSPAGAIGDIRPGERHRLARRGHALPRRCRPIALMPDAAARHRVHAVRRPRSRSTGRRRERPVRSSCYTPQPAGRRQALRPAARRRRQPRRRPAQPDARLLLRALRAHRRGLVRPGHGRPTRSTRSARSA